MEQVQKTADELRNQNFIDIQTFENLRCTYSVKNQIFPEFDFNMNGLNKSEPNNNNNKRKKKKKKNESDDSDDGEEGGENVFRQYCSKPINLQPGHTGYLTFATLLNKNYENISKNELNLENNNNNKESSGK